MRFLLLIIAYTYSFFVRARNYLYDKNILKSYSSKIPIICIGNLTVGGNAKTPLSALVYNEFKKLGKNPILLSRGYKSEIKTPYFVLKKDSAKKVGDEPLMLTKFFSMNVLVSPKRVDGVRYIEKNNLADLIILDDGFQHRKLNRDIDIIAINHTKNVLNDYEKENLLPLGRFREFYSKGKKRVDFFILINRSIKKIEIDKENIVNFFGTNKTFFASLSSYKFLHLNKNFSLEDKCRLEQIKDKEIIAICGLANPEGFFLSLRSLNLNLVLEKAYPDHYKFIKHDFIELKNKYPNAIFVCTLKDSVKIDPTWIDNIFILSNSLEVENLDSIIESINAKVA